MMIISYTFAVLFSQELLLSDSAVLLYAFVRARIRGSETCTCMILSTPGLKLRHFVLCIFLSFMSHHVPSSLSL